MNIPLKRSEIQILALAVLFILLCVGDGFAQQKAGKLQPVIVGNHDDPKDYPISVLPIWDDGLCEMSYYKTTTQIYDKPRSYTRVQLLNRQWMNPTSKVKTDQVAGDSIPVFKLNIVEEIPTENYNYRYQTTVFIRRENLKPFKMAISSQEWCGTSYKHFQWSKMGVTVQSFSYQNDDGVQNWNVFEEMVPYESLSVLARNVAATGKPMILNIMLPMQSNKAIKPKLKKAAFNPGLEQSVTVPAGTFQARRIDLIWEGPKTNFIVESKPPYRLLKFENGLTRGELEQVERRAYWDRNTKSSFYPPNQAP